MKSKAQKQAEAIERNAKYRDKYFKEAAEKFPDDKEKQLAWVEYKQGIPKKRR